MAIQVNSYILPNSVAEKMIAKINETRDKKIELGFSLCLTKKGNIITAGDGCAGTQCEMLQPKECPTGNYIGGYHTHPKSGTKPSIADLAVAYNDEVGCIGSVRDEKIMCMVRDGPMVPQTMQEIRDAAKNIEEGSGKIVTKEQFQVWESARDGILDKYFKVVDIK